MNLRISLVAVVAMHIICPFKITLNWELDEDPQIKKNLLKMLQIQPGFKLCVLVDMNTFHPKTGEVFLKENVCPQINLRTNSEIQLRTNFASYLLIFLNSYEDIPKKISFLSNTSLYKPTTPTLFFFKNRMESLDFLRDTVAILKKYRIYISFIIFHRDGLHAVSYDVFKNKFWHLNDLMDFISNTESHIPNLNGFKLRMAVFQNPPRIFKDEAGLWHSDYEFYWMNMLKELNATYELIETTPYDLDDAKDAVMKGEIDFCPLSYFKTSIPENLDFTSPLSIENLVVLVPKSELISRFTYIFMALSKPVWFFILIFMFIVVLFLVIVGKKRISQNQSISSTVLDVISILIGKSFKIYPHYSWTEKIFLGLCQMISIVIIAAFTSALISTILLDKHKDQINSLNDLVESKLTVYALPEMKKIVEEFSPSLNQQLVKIPRRNYSSLLKNQIYGQALVVPKSLSSDVLETVNVKGSDLEYRTMHESITSGFSTFFFTKNSPLVKIINNMQMRKQQFGLMNDIKRKRNRSGEKQVSKKNKPLSMRHLAGIFLVWLIGIGISIIIFILEIFHMLPKNC